MKELITHPILLELLEALDKKFYGEDSSTAKK